MKTCEKVCGGVLIMLVAVASGCAKKSADVSQTSTGTVPGAVETSSVVSRPDAGSSSSTGSSTRDRAVGSPETARGGPGSTMTSRPDVADFTAVPAVKDVYFEYDRYDIRAQDARVLDANAEWLKANPGTLVLIAGHTDERGTETYNLALGEKRARSAMDYLTTRGIQQARMTIMSYGEARNVCQDRREGCWSRNRRAQFMVKPR